MDRKGTKMFLSLSLARSGGCLKMPGDEHKTINRSKNHARSAIIFHHVCTDNCISRTTSQKGVNKMPKCFSCPGDCKELSKKTRRSTHDSNQARIKPWPTQLPTSDNNSPIMKQIGTNDTPKCLSNLGDCSGLSEEARRTRIGMEGICITHSCFPPL